MLFRFCHHQFRRLVGIILIAVPVDDDAVDAAADHVGDLGVNLRGIVRAVTDIDVDRIAPPGHKVGNHLGVVSGIEQAVEVDFADIACADIAVGLCGKAVGGAGVVRGQGCEGCGGDDLQIRAPSGCSQYHEDGEYKFLPHLSS